MTNGQIAQARELRKCSCLTYFEQAMVNVYLSGVFADVKINKYDRWFLHSTVHKYRHQIKAMKRNKVTP